MRDLGLDGVYVALQAGWEEMVGYVRGLAMSGGGGNITLPHKEKAATVVDVRSHAVTRTGACNTFWFQEGKIHGDNTDVEGFSRALEVFLGGPPEGKKALLLGAGGAARACLVGLMDGGAKEVHILNRTRDRARVVARRIGGARVRVLDSPGDAGGQAYDLVVNTTRLGLGAEDPLPYDLRRLGRAGAVMDVIYLPRPTRFVESARELGIRAADGMEMLVQQGAVSFERWWGQKPSLEVMRASLQNHAGL
jgi:shikimate dehydrogenase